MASTTRNLTGLALVTGMLVAVLLGLGIWQIERLGAKAELLARIDARIAAAPVALPDISNSTPVSAEFDYVKVKVSGTFRHDQESYLFGAIDQNDRGDTIAGYFVLTPLILENGATLIVNRGFVPQDKKNPTSRSAGQTPGHVTVTGLLRLPERKTIFTPDPDPLNHVLYASDPVLIAHWFGLERALPVLLDADATENPGGLPLGGHTIVSVPNNHLQYALTWFALAAVTIVMFTAYALKRGQGDTA